jgi:hypothetical protein
MTISSTNRVAGPYAGDGSTATFPFTFKVFSTGDLEVVTLNTASGAITPLALTTDYSAILNANQDTSPGGSITLNAGGLAVGLNLTITTDMSETQSVNLVNGGGFFPDVINTALDFVTILIQQLATKLGRAIRAPFGDSSSMELPAPALRAGKVLMFDANGNVQLVSVASGSIVPGAQTAGGLVNGTNKDFTFSAAAGATPSIIVFAGGVYQSPATDYGVPVFVSGSTWKITFTVAPANAPVTMLMLS